MVSDEALADGIIFDPATGETHFLNDLPLLLLSMIDREPRDLRRLCCLLTGSDDVAAESEMKITSALVSLAHAELVESTVPNSD